MRTVKGTAFNARVVAHIVRNYCLCFVDAGRSLRADLSLTNGWGFDRYRADYRATRDLVAR